MSAPDDLLEPWFRHLVDALSPLGLFDAHTHIGANDPDGFRQTADELMARLRAAGARAAVFPMHEPDGYAAANDEVLGAAADSGGRLVAFCRVDPHRGALVEARRCLDAGARGIKLHPRAERFELAAPAVRELVALAHERRLPVLIHAGRGIPALGRHALELASAFPDARLILAHAAVSDLAWIWRELPEHPNVLIDTSWWNPNDQLALFALVAPGQIVLASDSPYGTPVHAAITTLRCGLEAGLGAEQLREVAGNQMERLLAGEDPAYLGPAPGGFAATGDVLLDRVADNLLAALMRSVAGADDAEPLALARLGCAVGEGAPQAEVCSAILELLDRAETLRREPARDRVAFGDLFVIACALALARTPSVPVPKVPAEPRPERDAIRA